MLLERDGELGRLAQALDGAAAGSGRMIALTGPAGIGKSSLLDRVRRDAAARGFRLLTASGSELERAFPYGLCRQLFESDLTSAARRERQALLQGAAALAGRLLLAPPDEAAIESYAALHGLYWLAANMADDGPLLVAVDDAHWADGASVRFLGYLARRLEGLPIATVIAARETEPGAEDDLLQAILLAPQTDVLRLGPLSTPASAVVVRRAFGAEPAEAFVAACREATGGNPFYLTELSRTLVAAGVAPTAADAPRVAGVGPPVIARRLLGRVAHLGPSCVAFVRALAVLGGRADPPVVAALAGLDEREARRAADALHRAAIATGGVAPRLAHPIMRAAVYADIPPGERASAHRRAAALLAERSARASEVAVHLLHAPPGDDPWVLARLREAAGAALAEGAWRTAVAHLRRALNESPAAGERFALMRSLGSALAGLGDPQGIDVLHAATDCAPDAGARAQVAIPLASALVRFSRTEEGVEVLEEALAQLGEPGGARPPATQLEALLCVMGITDLRARRRLRDRLARTVERFRREPHEIADSVLSVLAIELIFAGAPATEAARAARRALRTGELVRRGTGYSPLPYVAAYALIATGEARLAERLLDEAAERATREGATGGLGYVSATRSLARLAQGDLRGAQADAELYLRLAEQQPAEVISPVAVATLVTAHVERGELDEAERALRSPVAAAVDPAGVLSQPLIACRARLCSATGDQEGAVGELERCRAWAADWGDACGSWPVQWRQALALAELRLGRAARAAALAREDVTLARRFGTPRALGRALVALGLAAGGTQGIAHLRDAVAALGRSEDRLEHARALVELGAALRRAGERAAARDPLSAGMRAARTCGAGALAARAYEELTATGARPRKILFSGFEALTPSELRVARMAAGGMTNREIAQALFITRKTVEVHLSHAYQKLDIASRAQLGAALDTGR